MSIIKKLYIQTSRGQVHGRMTARRFGLPLVLLHQTASSSAMYEKLMAELAADLSADFWLVALDTPGFGQSFVPAERPSTSFYATILWEALDQLDIGSCHLFGHHTGAAIAVQMAHAAPERVGKLILCGPPLLSQALIERLRAGLQPIVPDAHGRFLTDTWQRLRHKSPDAPHGLILRETLLTLQAGHSYPLAYEAVFDQPLAEQLAGLSQPTLILAGEQDSLHACLQPAHTLLPHSNIRSLPNADGYLCDRQPERVAAVLREFLC